MLSLFQVYHEQALRSLESFGRQMSIKDLRPRNQLAKSSLEALIEPKSLTKKTSRHGAKSYILWILEVSKKA